MAHHIDNPHDLFDIDRTVLNEVKKSSKEGTGNNSNGSDTETHDSSPSSSEWFRIWVRGEIIFRKLQRKELIKSTTLPLMRLILALIRKD